MSLFWYVASHIKQYVLRNSAFKRLNIINSFDFIWGDLLDFVYKASKKLEKRENTGVS